MKINAYGYQLSLRSFCKVTYFRLFCTHKEAKFHACTGADHVGNGDNVTIGVSFVCPRCRRSWCGDILACAPNKGADKALQTLNKTLRIY
ncbi:hypothetical protein KAU11_00435 [Candidatus Babeliales bacterium]|nr:hypothetical protein [Candidatus Babeliales bacterium]